MCSGPRNAACGDCQREVTKSCFCFHIKQYSQNMLLTKMSLSHMYLTIDWIISIKVRCGDLIKAWSLTTAGLCGRSIQKLNTVVKTNHILHIEENNDPKELPTRIFQGSLLNFESNISYFNANFHLFKS